MSEGLKLHFEVAPDDIAAAGNASTGTKNTLKKMGFPAAIIRRVAIAMYEGEINMVIHAKGGDVDVEIQPDRIVMTLADRGPGIPDIDLAMQEGWSTATENVREYGFGAGMGLPNMKKNTDEMRIDTQLGVGTTVTMTVYVA